MAPPSEEPGPLTAIGLGVSYFRPELRDMKVIGLEEHATFPALTARIPNEGVAAHAKRVFGQLSGIEAESYIRGRLTDLGDQRLNDMNAAGVAVQILSLAGPVNSMHMGEPQASLALARDINDELKRAVDANPQRFRALAELPVNAPDLAIQELRRAAP